MPRKRKESKLRKLSSSEDTNRYETTKEDCIYWFNVINQEIFGNTLSMVDEIDIRWRRRNHAVYWCEKDTTNPEYSKTKLLMNKRYSSKQFFMEVLAHEMIHHYQFMFHEPLGHGPSFMKWKPKLQRKGIRLVRHYHDE